MKPSCRGAGSHGIVGRGILARIVMRPAGGRRSRAARLATLVVAALTISGCLGDGVLAPASPEAQRIAELGWFMFAVSGAIMALVLGLVGWAVVRGRRDREARPGGLRLVVAGGIVLPAIVLPVLWFLSLPAMAEIAGADEPVELEVEVIGHRWYYEVRYPETAVLVYDELHLPLDQRVRIRVSSDDVIHSFWIPELGGKRDMLPGTVNELTVLPTTAATYGARCAEFCGMGHTTMTMRVVVEPRAELDTWLASEASDGDPARPAP